MLFCDKLAIVIFMKQEITISHLVVNGCSFTYCDGLESPATQGWPALLAAKLGVPVANIALGGTSNDRIYRKTVDYFFADIGSNPFYIMGMTSSTRREEYNNTQNMYNPLNLVSAHRNMVEPWQAEIERLLAEKSDDLVLGKRKLDIWLSIINLFKANSINYLMIDMIADNHFLMHELKQRYPKLYEYVMEDENSLPEFLDFTRPLGKLPCGHEDADTQIAIAEYIYNAMMERFTVIVNPSDYLRIKDFYTPHDPVPGQNPGYDDWVL